MKRFIQIAIVILLSGCFAPGLWAADITALIRDGVQDLKIEKGSPALLALTNATYVKINGQTTEGYVDMIQEAAGCSMGKGNLLFFHRPVTDPLKIVLFKKDTGDAVLITYDGRKKEKTNLRMGGDDAIKPDTWKQIQKKIGPDAFSIVSISTAWARGAPYDFLRCCELHNHLCPGVTAGYQMAQLILERYPLGQGETYAWIASPSWCKDDAIQILFDLTPGKRNLFAKHLTPDQKKAVSGETASDNIAGILVIWNNKAKKGKAVAFRYNWGKAREVSGVAAEDFAPKGGKNNPLFWISRLKCNVGLMPHLTKPAGFVSVVKEIEITPQMYSEMTIAGINPYKVIGLSK